MAKCWYCDHPIVPPVEIVGRWLAGTSRLVHKDCLRRLGELDLALCAADTPDPDVSHATPGSGDALTPRSAHLIPGASPTPPAAPGNAAEPGGQNQ